MGKPHVHKDLIIAWADGAEIEFKLRGEKEWRSYQSLGIPNNPKWDETTLYRIKPEPDIVKYMGFDCHDDERFCSELHNILEIVDDWHKQVKLTFDGETGKLKAVEIVK